MPPRPPPTTFTVEDLLTSPAGFGLTTASPLQRGICRIAAGLPLGELAEHPHVVGALGGVVPLALLNPTKKPKELLVISAIRCGKSLIAAALAFYWSQTCDVSRLRPGERARISILATDKDKARVVLDHLQGSIEAAPALRKVYLGEFKSDSVSGVLLKHPSGREIEVAVVAGARAGATLIARWSAGCIFDEAARMQGSDDGVVNWEDARNAVIQRLLPGAQLVSISSPWAPWGPVYDRVQEHWGHADSRLCVLKAPGPHMNPIVWTPEACEAAKDDPQSYRTDVLAEFADPESTLFSSDILDPALRPDGDLPYDDLNEYVAAMDPGSRSNSWSFVLVTKTGGKRVVAAAREWRAAKGRPLDPDSVLNEIGKLCKTYAVDTVLTDQYSADALRALGERHGVHLVITVLNSSNKLQMFEELRTAFHEGLILVPNNPQLLTDLRLVKKRVTQNGVTIVLPRTSDGRHCDLAAALALSMTRAPRDPLVVGPAWGTREYYVAYAEARLRETLKAAQVRHQEERDYDPERRYWWDQDPSVEDLS